MVGIPGTRGPPAWTLIWIGMTVAAVSGCFTALIRMAATSVASLSLSLGTLGPRTPRPRKRLGYHTPEECYEPSSMLHFKVDIKRPAACSKTEVSYHDGQRSLLD